MPRTHTVSQGDCISTIAARYGFGRWQTVWDHPNNAALKKQRKNPNVLLPGDQVFVPDPAVGRYACATGKTHVFKLKLAQTHVRIQLVDRQGRPYADAAYVIEIGDGGAPRVTKKGTTPADGLIDVVVPPEVTTARVRLVPKDETDKDAVEWQLDLGHLDPADETSGALARLDNLFPVGDIGVPQADRVKALLLAFQEMNGLAETGELDADTAAALEKLHDTVT